MGDNHSDFKAVTHSQLLSKAIGNYRKSLMEFWEEKQVLIRKLDLTKLLVT